MYFVIVGVPERVGKKLEDRLLKAKNGHEFGIVAYPKLPPRSSEALLASNHAVLKKIEHNFECHQGFAILNFCSALDASLSASFEPSIPCCFMREIDYGVETTSGVNRLVREVLAAVNQKIGKVVRNHGALKVELSKTNSTPLLLPVVNFKSEDLKRFFDFISKNYSSVKVESYLLAHKKRISSCMKAAQDGRKAFLSNDGLYFKTPGRAKHGSHPPKLDFDTDHKILCRVGSLIRFGVKIETGFHYDCKYEKGGSFSQDRSSCHGQAVSTNGCGYVNIYPNDYIRATKAKK
ncbi:hypothetical protein [Ruegeria jejuensis]|uniref:hypothetical protein n=1 Tax=Ruegeria jejuensis TaxID=3233338 RepID=UPI00355BD21D